MGFPELYPTSGSRVVGREVIQPEGRVIMIKISVSFNVALSKHLVAPSPLGKACCDPLDTQRGGCFWLRTPTDRSLFEVLSW
ncbi:uncharacterized protein PHALS_03107 [Plasmopara halstedii]|uniref:Uncharacterized protein n=1 Tax=Plasmopara halstedii TaxID=4781 RepID=A0A0P1A8L3_PLAHL|nr:uncharacterized protein PHALS_03107 [Plasmopara halstedii]CEG36559.1 hypothetical protein PHALS_03107 [Plasmopara halstedii]|eukprot:XP_024572928.1 hypothetical protein PHALS_03107 [Plasmopara halstedii]